MRQKTIPLQRTIIGTWASEDRRISLCSGEFEEFFDVPEHVNQIDLIISKRELPECYRVVTILPQAKYYLSQPFFKEVRLSIPGDDQSWGCVLTIGTDQELISMGLIGTFYIQVRY